MFKPALGSTLFLTATHCLALSLGAPQGGVIIGRPLDVVVTSNIDATEAAAGLCLEAEVMYGDMRVPASAISIAVQRLGAGPEGALKVRVTQPVNEPIVTLTLKAGCQNSFRRSYTLLADFESPPVPAASTYSRDVTAPTTARTSEARQPDRPRAANDSAAATKTVVSEPAVPALSLETPVKLTAPLPRPAGVTRVASKARPPARQSAGTVVSEPVRSGAAAGARLKLDPIELPAGAGSPASTAAAPVAKESPGASPPDAPASAAAPTGDATPAQPSVPNDAQALQQQLQQLREEQQRLRVAMESVNAQLTDARSDRYQNPLVYGLSAAVLLLLAGLWRLKKRERTEFANSAQPESEQPWWKSTVEDDAEPDLLLESTPGDRSETNTPTPDLALTHDHQPLGGIEAVETSESVFLEVPVSRVDLSVLLELWQQVDFLVSIGQSVEALQVLESFVLAHPRASEAVYLRWLQLALQQSNERALAQAQAAYESHYHRLLPAGAATVNNRPGLEADTAFVARLAQAWSTGDAQRLLGDALCSQPGDPANALRERGLLVFDDVITLLRVLATLPELPVPAPQPETTAPPSAAPLVASEESVAQWLSVGDVPEAAAAAPAPAAVQEKADLPPLDFEFLDFGAPPAGDSTQTGQGKPQG